MSMVEEDTAHSSLGGIGGSKVGGSLGDDLSKVSGTMTQAGSQVGEGIHVGPEGAVDSDSVALGLGECQLKCTEEASGSGDHH